MTSSRTRERLIERLREEGISDVRVLAAMRAVPRHLFVEEALASRAYEDMPLPIGHGQTISQPYIVALMTAALVAGEPPKRVLEIGTGCGYQTAVLARLVAEVWSVERIRALLGRARKTLLELGIRNVNLRYGDGGEGWAECAPFDAILVTAAPEEVPPALLAQLAPGGRLIVPIGTRGAQRLMLYRRGESGIESEPMGAVSFVPFAPGVTAR
ncbi:MAG TPA: protein-L-isoaspartate(D-aspartate) O-methyltransferase [Gammaproteobacteria bacterium]|nr:protein-L-isoaspartate(D-aspartate) O-methyltransferase [Gammaproteobacteria bacterium]